MDLMDVRREMMGVIAQMASGKGIDVTITENYSKKVPDFANFLFSAGNCEYGKEYVAILKSTTNPNKEFLVKAIAFYKNDDNSSIVGGAVRMNSNGTQAAGVTISTSYDARGTIGDIYTIFCI